MRRADKQLARSDDLILKFQKRTMARQVAAWCAYNDSQRTAKGSLSRAFRRMTRWKTARHFKRWVAAVELINQEQLQKDLNKSASKVDTKNQVLGEYQHITERQQKELTKITEMAQNRARRQLGNYYARFYSNGCKKAFRTWRDCYRK